MLIVVISANISAAAANELPTGKVSSAASAVSEDQYLTIFLRGREGNKWIIYLGGPNPYYDWSGGYQYNSKMCYFNDAKNWTGLKDVVTVKQNDETIPGYTGKRIEIQSNGFATSVTFSYVVGYTRYITYADHLFIERGEYTMTVYHNTVTV